MIKLITRWLLLAAALLLIEHLYHGLSIGGFGSALLAALVLGLLNAVVRPLLIILTLPATILTLGLFLLVINATTFYLTASLTDDMSVNGFGSALVASLFYSVCSIVIDMALERLFPPR
jgi:putative membrane protein